MAAQTVTKVNLTETGCEVVDWLNLVQQGKQWLTFAKTVRKFGFHKGVEFLDQLRGR
jgi:hypothetical protein